MFSVYCGILCGDKDRKLGRDVAVECVKYDFHSCHHHKLHSVHLTSKVEAETLRDRYLKLKPKLCIDREGGVKYCIYQSEKLLSSRIIYTIVYIMALPSV